MDTQGGSAQSTSSRGARGTGPTFSDKHQRGLVSVKWNTVKAVFLPLYGQETKAPRSQGITEGHTYSAE